MMKFALRAAALIAFASIAACVRGSTSVARQAVADYPWPIRYPEPVRSANVEGVVILDLALDSLGRYDRSRTRVVSETHGLFTLAVRQGIDSAARAPALYAARRFTAIHRDTFASLPFRDSTRTCSPRREHWTPVCAIAAPSPRAVVP